ncbi:MAG: Putative lipoprotein/NMB1162 [Parabacteroides sp.]|jgi:putative lipoprotein
MKKLVYLLLIAAGLVSCTTTNEVTRQKNYPKMYEDKPLSILIMPPINKTVDVDAKEYFYTSMAKPLCEKGYYVISPFVAMDFLKSESAYDSELFIDGDLAPFRNILGADAVLFTVINKWDKSTIGGKITVDIEYVLKSTATREVLFERKGELTVDTSVNSGGGGWGALIDLAASALSTALTDKVVAARRCNNYVLRDLPEGRYSPLFEKDQDVEAGGPVFSGVVKY